MGVDGVSPVELVMSVLERSGYRRLPKPLTVAGAEYDFEAAVQGAHRSHDLVLVASDRVSALRLERLLAGLARSLDLARSRQPITLVVVGELGASHKGELERVARVLHIDSPAPSEAQVEQAVAILLPLDLPTGVIMHGRDRLTEVMESLGPGAATGEHIALVRAAMEGAEGVRETLRDYVNAGIPQSSQNGAQDG